MDRLLKETGSSSRFSLSSRGLIRHLRRLALIPLLAVPAIAGCDAPVAQNKADCIYTQNSTAALAAFELKVGHVFNCVMVFSNANPTWASFENPWFLGDGPSTSYDWTDWVNADPNTPRELIITPGMVPSDVQGTDWLSEGAAGDFDGYARTLAQNLVNAGLGYSVIRLGHEANDPSSIYTVAGLSSAQLAEWVQTWRNMVLAMKSVSGAHFTFDWCINAYWQPLPLSDWYPGDDVVDTIGIDAYDSGVPVGQDRWTRIYTQPDGIQAVLDFAQAHGKPVSFPEWGLAPTGAPSYGGGDDPAYVNHIADTVANNDVAYQSYFYGDQSQQVLDASPNSLAAYEQRFP